MIKTAEPIKITAHNAGWLTAIWPALVSPHCQFRISGRSSPCLSMYCLCFDQLVLELLLQVDAPVSGLGQAVDGVHHEMEAVQLVQHRHVEGVVIVPSSLYPRTWMLSWFVRRYVSRWISHG